jgi:hypothetical protein
MISWQVLVALLLLFAVAAALAVLFSDAFDVDD